MKYLNILNKRIVKAALQTGLALAVAIAVIAPSATATAQTGGTVGVSAGTGKLLVYGTSTTFNVRGFISIGLLFPQQYASSMCSGVSQTAQTDLTAVENDMTGNTETLIKGMKDDWYANTVRFMLSQGALTYEHENGLSAYTDMVKAVVDEARKLDMVVIVVMQTEAYSCTPLRSDGQLQKLPDQLTEEAWAQLIPALPSNDRSIILDVFNEPDTSVECAATIGSSTAWTDWATGCGTGTDEGNKTVGNYVRGLAPDNVLMFDADNSGGTYANFTPPSGMPSNTIYSIHPYYYYLPGNGGSITPLEASTSNWNTRFGDLQAAGYPVLATAWNEASTCPADSGQTVTDNFVDTYMPAHYMGLLLYAWDDINDESGYVVNESTFAPVNSNSACSTETGATLVQDFFATQSGH